MREFARRNGVSVEAISRAVKTGRLPSVNGKLDAAAAQAAWEKARDPARAGRKLGPKLVSNPAPRPPTAAPAPGTVPTLTAAPARPAATGFESDRSYGDAKMQREYIRLTRDRVELKKLLEGFVDVQEARQEFGGLVTNTKSRLLSLGHRLAPALALEADPAKCQALVDDAIVEALADLSNYKADL